MTYDNFLATILFREEIFRHGNAYIDDMELLFLFFLYYLSQNPKFSENMKPILGSLKSSEDILKFMNDLSNFSKMFSPQEKPPSAEPKNQTGEPQKPTQSPQRETQQDNSNEKKDEKNPQSPTSGIADDFIERCLQNYFKNR